MLDSNFCRVCGLDMGYPIWGDDGKTPSFDICPCCGTEFGYHDSTIEGIHRKRSLWLGINHGEWHQVKEKPTNWDINKQMRQIPKEFS